jgi:PAS domain S-box-containing protein
MATVEQQSAAGADRRSRQRRRGIARRHADIPWTTAPRVLLITSALDARLTYAGLLEEAGYAVYVVSDALDALKSITMRMPDAVVIGQGSSGADCLALLSALRADVTTSDVPAVILTSSQVQSTASDRDRHTGPTMLLGEPVSADAVLGAVDDLTRATPPERFARRQLRRSLITLRNLAHPQPSGPHASNRRASDGTQLRAVIDRLHVPIVALDADGGYVAISRGAEALTGYTRAEITATSVFDSGMGSHLPLASIWEAHSTGTRRSGTTSLRDKSGRTLKVAYLIDALTAELHVLLLVHAAE